MIEDIQRFLNILALLLLGIGGVIAIWICIKWPIIDKNLIKAKIFLNEKFLRELWFYMFIAMCFFAINEVLILFLGDASSIAILAGVFKVIFVSLILKVLIDYFKLVKPCIRTNESKS